MHVKDWLVFERLPGEPIHAYASFARKYFPPWHVKADDEEAAAKVVLGVVGRISTFAVVEATIIDLESGDPRGTNIEDLVPRGPRQL